MAVNVYMAGLSDTKFVMLETVSPLYRREAFFVFNSNYYNYKLVLGILSLSQAG